MLNSQINHRILGFGATPQTKQEESRKPGSREGKTGRPGEAKAPGGRTAGYQAWAVTNSSEFKEVTWKKTAEFSDSVDIREQCFGRRGVENDDKPRMRLTFNTEPHPGLVFSVDHCWNVAVSLHEHHRHVVHRGLRVRGVTATTLPGD